MSEQNPDELMLQLPDGSEHLMTRQNSRLYTFFGNLATRNHVYCVFGENEDRFGMHVFSHGEPYQHLVSFMLAHSYPMSLNSLEVSEGDEEAFQKSLEQLAEHAGENVPDEIPDWMEDGQA